MSQVWRPEVDEDHVDEDLHPRLTVVLLFLQVSLITCLDAAKPRDITSR